MALKKPYSWQREWDPQRDYPPMPRAHELDVAALETLATRTISMPPMGRYMFSQTREVEIEGAIEYASGRSHDRWVYYRRGNKQFVRAFIQPRDPKTGYQVEQRQRFKHVLESWHTMTYEQRQDWDRFAATIPHLAWDSGSRGLQHGYRANRLYRSAQLNRLALGLPVSNDAPTAKVTAQINSVEIVPAPQNGQIAFRLFYGGKVQPGLRVMVEMTRAMPSVKRCPRENELTKAATTEAASYFDLGENGATYVIENPRYEIEPGQRFGLRLTFVSEEGLRSRSLFKVTAYGAEPQAADLTSFIAENQPSAGQQRELEIDQELRGVDTPVREASADRNIQATEPLIRPRVTPPAD